MNSIEPQEKQASSRNYLAALGVVILGCILHLPNLGLVEMHREEGRRAIPAREMIASGDWVLPTIWGEPYLNKPPLYTWSVAAIAKMRDGRVDEIAVRLPSVLASIACALLLLRWGRRRQGTRVGILAAVTFYLGLEGIAKANLGETDLVFCAWILAAIVFLDEGMGGRRRALVASGLCLGAALLTKGPLALVFYLGADLGWRWTHGGGENSPRGGALLGWITGIVTAGLWGVLLLAHPGGEVAIYTWSEELSRSGGSGAYFRHRLEFVFGVIGGFLPASVILLITASRGMRNRWKEDPLIRQCLLSALVPLLFLLFWPGVQPRYALPALPLCSLAVARILDGLLTAGDLTVERRIAVFAQMMRALVALAAIVFVVDLVAGDFLRSFVTVPHLDFIPEVIALLGLLAVAFLPLGWCVSRLARSLWRLALIIVIIRLIQLSVVLPAKVLGDGSPRRAFAQRVEEAVPAGEVLYIDIDEDWNWLVQIDREIRIAPKGEAPPSGSWLLMGAGEGSQGADPIEPGHLLSGTLFLEERLPHEGKVLLMRVHRG